MDLSTRGHRIKFIRKEVFGFKNQQLLADLFGKGKLSRGAVGNWELGGDIGTDNLIFLADRAGTTVQWIEDGVGVPPISKTIRHEEPIPATENSQYVSDVDGDIGRSRPDEIIEADVRSGAGGGGIRDYNLVVHDHNGNTYHAESVAGVWRIPEAVTDGLLHATPKHLLCFEVIGDSMEPRLHSGDRVFVDTRDRFPNPEGIFVLWDGYSTVVKRVQIIRGSDPARLKVISANEQYDPYEILAEEAKIIGRYAGRFTVE